MNKQRNYTPITLITTEELIELVRESKMMVQRIEKGVGMPINTLQKVLKNKPESNGHLRKLPTKWVEKTLRYLKEQKVKNEEIKLEVKEVLIEHNIAVVEEEVDIPDEKRKRDWIEKLQETKSELN